MKIIDLLNKIAKGEEVPKKIKYKGTTYEKVNDGDIDFYIGKNFNGTLLLEKLDDTNELNDEVEIIEEEQYIEEISMCTGGIMGFDGVENITGALKDKINELIKAVNELKNGSRKNI